VHPICLAEERQVDVVVDYEQDPGVSAESAQAAGQDQEVAAAYLLLAKLEDVGTASDGAGGHIKELV
jgi:hypothetical protein